MSENDVIWETDKLKVKLTGDRLSFYVFNGWMGEGIEDIEITQFAQFWLTKNGFEVFEVMKKKPKLKPCPFCGRKATAQECQGFRWIGCRDCKINSDRFFNEEHAIKHWNALPRKEGGNIG